MSALKTQLKLILPGLSKEANANQDKEIRRHLYLVKAVCASPKSVSQVCESRGVSSDQFYLWGNRLLKSKVLSCLKSKSRKPKHSPKKTKQRIERKILAMRKAEPSHGPERISFYLKELFNIICPPATVYNVLLRLKLISKANSKKLTKKHHKRYRRPLPGYMQMDVKYVPYRINGQQYYEFNIVDHCTTWRVARIYRNITQHNTVHFLNEVLQICPFPIFEIQTDNGNEFTDKFRNGLVLASGVHPMDRWCESKGIPHRLIPIGQKELNGKVENTHKQDDREFYAGTRETSFEKIELRMRSYIERWNGSRATKALGWQTPNQCVDAGFVRALAYLMEMQVRYAPGAVAAYNINTAGDAFIRVEKPQPQPRKKQKPKKLTSLDRYLQWLDWDEKQGARALAPLLPVMSKIFS